MCTHQKFIRNPYNQKRILVKCGHCDACKQEKAINRALRIRSNIRPDYICCMCGLTYRNDCVPYIYKEDLYDGVANVPIYRDSKSRYVYNPKKDELYIKESKGQFQIGELDITELDYTFKDIQQLKPLTHMKDKNKVGVIYYKDLQNFMKRLRINLKRKYNYDFTQKHCSFYAASEFGEENTRPHFHLLVFIPRSDYELFKRAIRETWSYDDGSWERLCFEETYGASQYVSGYVNKSSTLPKILKQKPFSPKWSYSQGFGVNFKPFQPEEVIKKIRMGNLFYTMHRIIEGVPTDTDFLLPKYVISRMFPKFKGLSRLTCDETLRVLEKPCLLQTKRKYTQQTLSECRKAITMLKNKHDLLRKYGVSPTLYALLYINAWNLYYSGVYKMQFSNVEKMDDYKEVYENTYEIKDYPNLSPTLKFENIDDIEKDPNKYKRVKLQSQLKQNNFRKMNDVHLRNQKLYKHFNYGKY